MTDYADIVKRMKRTHRVRVRRWRQAMSGCAWREDYSDGRSIRWIESPRPHSPITLAIFLHEIGHHAIGFDRFRLRCEEEYHVWCWAMEKMSELGVEPDPTVRARFDASMRYAVSKAQRRGIKRLPEALSAFAEAPAQAA